MDQFTELLEAGDTTGRGEYLPTREEIREACLHFQSTWTKAERQKRFRGESPIPMGPTPPPVYKSTDDVIKNVVRRKGMF